MTAERVVLDGENAARRHLAPAKINLFLHITGRRADGYHLLDSLVVFPDWGDQVFVSETADKTSLDISGPFAAALKQLTESSGKENLVHGAVNLLAAQQDTARHVALRLVKNIPPAAGLGGGSADAAAVLRQLRVLWNSALSDTELASMALGLGADLPVCLLRQDAYIGGIGEQITLCEELPKTAMLLCNPGIALSTAVVFAAYAGAEKGFSKPSTPWRQRPRDARDLGEALERSGNDLQEAACAACPAIGALLEQLADLPGVRLARMSGSGASCFGLFDDDVAAQAAGRVLARSNPGLWWRTCTIGGGIAC